MNKKHHSHNETAVPASAEAQVRSTTVEKINSQPLEKLMVAQASGASSTSGNVAPLVPPTSVAPPPEPEAQVAPQHWQMSAQALEEASARHAKTNGDRSSRSSHRSHRSHQVCPHCGATDTERRRRKMWEKVAFAFTSIRAYNCRICGGDFYAKRKPKSEE